MKNFIIGVLSIIVIGLGVYLLIDKDIIKLDKEPVQENNNKDENIVNKTETVNLSNSDKIKINSQLNGSLFYSIDRIVKFEQNDLTYNNNLLNSVENKYYVTWFTMLSDESMTSNFDVGLTIDGTYETGAYAINKSFVKEYYENMYNEAFNANELLNNQYVDVSEILLHDSFPAYVGEYPFVLKVNNLERINNNYILTIDFLTSFLDKNNRKIDYELLNLYNDSEIISGYENLVYAKMKVEYTTDKDNYILKSIKFEKTNQINDELNKAVSKTLTEKIGKDEEFGIEYNEESIIAEGHKILGSELKDNKLYVYVVAQMLSLNVVEDGIAIYKDMTCPMVIIYNIKDGYQFSRFLLAGVPGGYEIEDIFPKYLIDYAESVDYKDSYYQDQIHNYQFY